MTRLLTIIALLFATPVSAEKLTLRNGEEYEVRTTLACTVLNHITVRMDDFGISSHEYSKNLSSSPTIVKMLINGDLVIGLDHFKRYLYPKESNEGFFIWGKHMQIELKQTDFGLLMIWNERDGSWASGKNKFSSTHRWLRCSQ